MNTAIRLLVLIPAAAVCALLAFLSFGFGGLNVASLTLAIVLAITPVGLIAWTVADHRKRTRRGS